MNDPQAHAPSDEEEESYRALSETDAALARITEDLIEILLRKGVIQFTDFPEAAQAKLLERRQTREHLAHHLKLLDDDPGLI